MFRARLSVHVWKHGQIVDEQDRTCEMPDLDRLAAWFVNHLEGVVMAALECQDGSVEGFSIGFKVQPEVRGWGFVKAWRELLAELAKVISILPENNGHNLI